MRLINYENVAENNFIHSDFELYIDIITIKDIFKWLILDFAEKLYYQNQRPISYLNNIIIYIRP
jgi:hypothetical protein